MRAENQRLGRKLRVLPKLVIAWQSPGAPVTLASGKMDRAPFRRTTISRNLPGYAGNNCFSAGVVAFSCSAYSNSYSKETSHWEPGRSARPNIFHSHIVGYCPESTLGYQIAPA